jgi:hypothetical protein
MPEPFISDQTSASRVSAAHVRDDYPRRPTGDSVQLVRVVDIDIKFWSMVGLFVKASIAAIPAFIILCALGLLFAVTSAFWLGFLNGFVAK